jgi:hypothetical protein
MKIIIFLCKQLLNYLLPGLLLCILYPNIHSLFLTAAKNGYIPYTLSIWQSICISWLSMIIFRTQTVTNSYYNIINKLEEIKNKEDGSGPIS